MNQVSLSQVSFVNEEDGVEICKSTAENESDCVHQRRLERKLKRHDIYDDRSEDEDESKDIKICNKKQGENEKDTNALTKRKDNDVDSNQQNEMMFAPEDKLDRCVSEIISNELVSSQGTNGEVLLQNYQKKGMMSEVFGSQSLLSQELMQPNSMSQISTASYDTSHQEGLQSIVAKQHLKMEQNSITASINNHKPQTTEKTSNIEINDESQKSFIVESLPPLSIVSESQVIQASQTNNPFLPIVSETQATQPSQPNDVCSSQKSILSGYDMIIGAAQALAESKQTHAQDGQDSAPPFDQAGNNIPPYKVSANDNNYTFHVKSEGTPQAPALQLSIDLTAPPLPNALTVADMLSNLGTEVVAPPQLSDGDYDITEQMDSTGLLHTRKRARSTINDDDTITKLTRQEIAASTTGYIQTNGTTYSVRRTKSQRKKMEEETQYTARRAAELVEQLRVDRKVEKQLLLSMALTRENPRSAPARLPPRGTVILSGFYWGQFPPLEQVLRAHMEEYYELSIEKCQSRTQQAFNNKLVSLVESEATKYGWTFDHNNFDEKKIRDRIRCFFKTHIQNAKKRLKTMVRNPSKRANAKALAAHLDLIEKCDLIEKMDECDMDNVKAGIDEDTTSSMQDTKGTNTYDSDAHDAAQVLALGFGRLSQDEHVIPGGASNP